jgi:hypothetical protein
MLINLLPKEEKRLKLMNKMPNKEKTKKEKNQGGLTAGKDADA